MSTQQQRLAGVAASKGHAPLPLGAHSRQRSGASVASSSAAASTAAPSDEDSGRGGTPPHSEVDEPFSFRSATAVLPAPRRRWDRQSAEPAEEEDCLAVRLRAASPGLGSALRFGAVGAGVAQMQRDLADAESRHEFRRHFRDPGGSASESPFGRYALDSVASLNASWEERRDGAGTGPACLWGQLHEQLAALDRDVLSLGGPPRAFGRQEEELVRSNEDEELRQSLASLQFDVERLTNRW